MRPFWPWFVDQVWPNLFASALVTAFGLFVQLRRFRTHMHAHHTSLIDEIREHVIDGNGGGPHPCPDPRAHDKPED